MQKYKRKVDFVYRGLAGLYNYGIDTTLCEDQCDLRERNKNFPQITQIRAEELKNRTCNMS